MREFLRFVISDNDLQREFPLLHCLSQVFVFILDTTDVAENLYLYPPLYLKHACSEFLSYLIVFDSLVIFPSLGTKSQDAVEKKLLFASCACYNFVERKPEYSLTKLLKSYISTMVLFQNCSFHWSAGHSGQSDVYVFMIP